MILMFKAKYMIMIIRLKYSHDGLSFILILAPGHEFFPAKYVQFPLTFTE